MTKAERKVLEDALTYGESVGATAAEFGPDGYKSHHAEADRLMKSEDYRKGYQYCFDRMKDAIRFAIDKGGKRDQS